MSRFLESFCSFSVGIFIFIFYKFFVSYILSGPSAFDDFAGLLGQSIGSLLLILLFIAFGTFLTKKPVEIIIAVAGFCYIFIEKVNAYADLRIKGLSVDFADNLSNIFILYGWLAIALLIYFLRIIKHQASFRDENFRFLVILYFVFHGVSGLFFPGVFVKTYFISYLLVSFFLIKRHKNSDLFALILSVVSLILNSFGWTGYFSVSKTYDFVFLRYLGEVIKSIILIMYFFYFFRLRKIKKLF